MRVAVQIATVFALAFLSLGFISTHNLAPTVQTAFATSTTITLNGSFWNGWNGTNPGPTITVVHGDMVRLNLISTDGAPHTFIVDVAHAGIVPSPNCSIDKCSPVFRSAGPLLFTFTADMPQGMYTYYCSIHLQRMVGTLNVLAGSGGTPDFAVSASSTSLNIAQGSTGSATISLNSINGFSGTVSLSAAISPSGPQASLSATSVTLASNGSGSTTLSVATSSGGLYSTPTAQGPYTITVTGASGMLSHSTMMTVNVGSTSSGSSGSTGSTSMPASYGSISGTPLILGVALVLVAVVAVVTVALHRRRASP